MSAPVLSGLWSCMMAERLISASKTYVRGVRHERLGPAPDTAELDVQREYGRAGCQGKGGGVLKPAHFRHALRSAISRFAATLSMDGASPFAAIREDPSLFAQNHAHMEGAASMTLVSAALHRLLPH